MRSRPLVWSLLLLLFITVASLGATVATGTTPLLGLDLKGGVSVTEKPQGKVTKQSLQESVNIIDRRVDGLGVSAAEVSTQGNDLVIELPGAKNDTQVLKIVGKTAQLFFRPVLCEIEPYLSPAKAKTTKTTTGTTTTVPGKASQAKTTTTTAPAVKTTTTVPAKVVPKTSTTSSAQTTTKSALRRGGLASVDLSDARLAVATGTTTTVGGRSSTTKPVSTPTTTSPSGSTTTEPAGSTTTTTSPTTTTTSPNEGACNLTAEQQLTYMPPGGNKYGDTPAALDTANATVVLPFYTSLTSAPRYVLGPAEMSGSVVKSASAQLNSQNDEWEVDITFTSKGEVQFNNAATSHYECYLEDKSNPPYCALQAIELDATVYSAPSIDASSFPTGAQITGAFTSQQASSLALDLNYGSLPVRFQPQDISTISPEIGTASLKAGAVAGGVAVLLVLLYLVWYYRALGLVVVIGICMSGALLYSITDLLSQTNGLALTLSGVIGLIVSVGVTADSCVVYFERLKEEIRSGRTVRTSVEKGFNRAFRTILAADFSSFIAALILYSLTVGDVRGFAFFLGLATLLNVVTTYFFTRPLVILIGRRATMSSRSGALGVSRGLGAGTLTP